MVSSENRFYGWTLVIAGAAFLVGGVAMLLNAVSMKMYLVPFITGPIVLLRGISLLRQNCESSTSAKPSAAPSEDKVPAAAVEPPSLVPQLPPPLQTSPAEPAWLRESFSTQPLRPILPTLVVPPADKLPEPAVSAPPVPDPFTQGMWSYVLPCSFFLGVLVLVVYITPALLGSWRIAEARSEAEAIYIKRRAELRADFDHAEEVLDKLDKRLFGQSHAFRAVAMKVKPMVVSVCNLVDVKSDPMARPVMIYDPNQDKQFWQTSVGSGFIVRPGFILTNHHVVKEASQLRITFASGQSVFVPASAVTSDSIMDLAVIRMPAHEDMKAALEFADSDKDVFVGDWALTIGSPLGLKNSLSHGVISAKGRLTNWLPVELLQTDAAINPGNSGGPLLDQLGRVIGVNVAIASDNGRNQGIGFAIPSNAARKIVDKLINDGEVPHGFLGISLQNLPVDRVQELGKQDIGGALIQRVESGTPASKAGLHDGDIVVRFNNEALARAEPVKHLHQMIAGLEPGTEVTLEVLRGVLRLRLHAVLGKRPKNLP